MNAVDTNIFVYALSVDEPERGPRAANFLDSLTASDTVLLWQVACEFGAVIARLFRQGRVGEEAFVAISAIRDRFPLVLPSAQVLDSAFQLYHQHQLSYWDAMVISACIDAGVTRLYSEDLPGSASLQQLEIINPFAAS